MAQLDPDVISFLKQRNAPLTNNNYNSVRQLLEANPSLRGGGSDRPGSGQQNEPSPSDKEYDGGLDELNLGDDAKVSHNEIAVKHGSDDAKSAHAPNGASRNNGPANNAEPDADDGPRHGSQADNAPSSNAASNSDNDGDDPNILQFLFPAAVAGGAGGAAAARDLVGLGGGPPATISGAPAMISGAPEPGASGPADLLAGHAPPAALPAPQLQIGGPAPQAPNVAASSAASGAASPEDMAQRIAQLQADRFASDNGMHAAGSPASTFVQMANGQGAGAPQQGQPALPDNTGARPFSVDGAPSVAHGAAPASRVIPMPDNAANGTLQALMQKLGQLKQANPEMLDMLMRALQAGGHIR